MTMITLDSQCVDVRLSRAEKVFALRRHDIRLPLSAVRSVAVEPDAVAAARGLRAPGLAIPNVVKIGTWRSSGRRSFVSVRRGTAAVRMELDDSALDALLVSTPHADAVAEQAKSSGIPYSPSIEIDAGDVTLRGTLVLPAGAGPHPVALILPGSGPLDRDGNVRGARLGVSRDIATALAAHGIASLRYDRRGVGQSGGNFLSSGLGENIRDARAALRTMRQQPHIDSATCFLIGHSEGGLLAAAVAGEGEHDGLAGVVLLATSAKTGEDALTWQTEQIAPTLPTPVRILLRLLRTDLIRKQAKNVERLQAATSDVVRIDGRKINARWHREFIAFDPQPALARISAPVLAITGDKDIQVDPADLEVVARTVRAPVETHRIPDLTHIMRRDASPASLSRYRKLLRQPTDAEVLDRVCAWVAARASGTDGRTARDEPGK